MSDAIFLPEDFTETLEIEAKLAQGRDGRGEFPHTPNHGQQAYRKKQ